MFSAPSRTSQVINHGSMSLKPIPKPSPQSIIADTAWTATRSPPRSPVRASGWITTSVVSPSIERLAEAERALVAVEEEILREVEAMRPTKGRVSWPKPLPTMKRFREMREEADRRWEEQRQREEAAWAVKQAANDERRRIEQDRQNEIEIAEYRRQFALLPPEEQARQRDASQKIIDLVESGQVSTTDLFGAVMKKFGPKSE